MKTIKELREARRGKKIELEVNAANIKREIELAMKDKTNWAGGNKNAMNWNFIDADVYYAIKPTQSKSKMYYKIFNNILDGILTKQNKLNKGMGNKLMKTGPRTRTVESVDEGLVGMAVKAVGRSVAQKAVAPKNTTSPTTISNEDIERMLKKQAKDSVSNKDGSRSADDKRMVRSDSPNNKAAVKKYISGMKSRRPGNQTEMSDLEKTRSMATTAGLKTKTPDQKKKERDAAAKARGDRPNPEMLGMGEASLHRMNLINKMKKASPAAKKALEAPSRVDVKDTNVTYDRNGRVVKEAYASRAIVKKDRQGDGKPMGGYDKVAKKYGVKTIKLKDRQVKLKNFRLPEVSELTIADIRKGTEKAKKRQEIERQDTGKTSTSTTDLAARKEMKEPSSDYNAKMDKIPVSQMTPAQKKANSERRKEYKAYQMKKGITPFVPHPDKVKEENLNELSPEVRQSYRKKAMANRNKADLNRTMGLMNKAKGKGRNTDRDIKKADDTLAKRDRGQALFNKQKDKNLPKESVASADKKAETYTKPDGKTGVRMVRMDKNITNEGGMKRMSTGDGMDTFKKKPPEKKEAIVKPVANAAKKTLAVIRAKGKSAAKKAVVGGIAGLAVAKMAGY